MISMHLPNEAYQLAAEHALGEPIRMYRTNKRRWFKILGWSIAITFLFLIIIVLAQTPSPFRFTGLYSILIAIMIFVTLLFFVPLLLIPITTIYICSSGFIMHRKNKYRIVPWEDIEWVIISNNDEPCIIYLANKERIILSRLIGDLAKLAQEIELKARLIKRPEGRESLERQFEHLQSSLAARNQEKYARLREEKRPIEKTIPEDALRIQEEYRLGEVVATCYGGFKGILRRKAVGLSIYYLLLLACVLLFINEFVHFLFPFLFPSDGSFLALIVFFLLYSLFTPRFFARFTQLHLYAEGFIYMDGSSFEVVCWEQIEKVIYHKTIPALSPPFCHIYLTNGDTLMVSAYIHGLSVVKQVFDEHVVNKVQVG